MSRGPWVEEMPVRRRRYSDAEKAHAIRAVIDSSRSVVDIASELGVGAGTLRRWVRTYRHDAAAEAWAEQVERHFGFIDRFGFVLTSVDASNLWEVRATYRSERAALAVIRSVEFQRVEVQLMRLIDGELPEYPIFVVDSVAVNTFYVDDLVALRRADADQVLARQHGLLAEEVEDQLTFWSDALREHGQDFLAGDLRVLDELERLVRDRTRQYPQEVVVWLPDSASAEERAHAIKRAQADVPAGVTVTARRYRQARRREL